MENIAEKKLNKRERFVAFLGRNYALIFTPVLVLVAYLVALILYGVFPLGDKYTAASYDLSAQICPFIEHLFDVLQGKSSLAYSHAIVGGADVLGTFLYFFISPFSLVFLVLGDGMVAHASSIVMALKLVAIAFVGVWFAKKLFKGIPDYLCVIIGVLYAYCGYTFVANTYINWLDFLIYLPFATGAFKRFVQTGRYLPFSILVACCIYTCFSIACFSMFVAFPALIFFGLLCVEKEKRNRFLARLCLAFLVGVLLALPVLLPALSAYMRSGRTGDLFENFWYGFTVNESGVIGEFSVESFMEKFEEAAYRKWSYIISDSAFLILTVIWFFRRGLRDSFAKFMLVAGIFTLLPVLVDEAMLLMNMGSYMSYALRFGFLNALYFLGGACLALDGLCYKNGYAFDGERLTEVLEIDTASEVVSEQKSQKKGGMYAFKRFIGGSFVWTVAFVCVGVAVAVFLLWFIANGNYKTIWETVVKNSTWKAGLSSFSGRFAHSLGGAEVVGVFCVLVVVVTVFGAVLVWRKKLTLRVLSVVLMVIVGVQAVFYNNQIVLGNRSTQHVDLGAYQRLCEKTDELYLDSDEGKINGGYYRVKDFGDKLTAVAPFTGGSNSFSVFSSVIDKDNFIVGELFGYSGNFKNTLKSAHSTKKYNLNPEFGDSFLGYKYYFVTEQDKMQLNEDAELKKYVRAVTVTGEDGTEVPLQDGGYYIYENTITFPSAYKVASGAFKFVAPNEANSTYRRENQAALYEFLRGQPLSTKQVDVETAKELSEYLWSRAAKLETGAGKLTARVQATA
ncbi:MAG: YfhO family protein, partial [Clostridia bacterium]|nr:YfhO family protein [Clostridia bacterium]